MDWLFDPVIAPNTYFEQSAQQRQNQLTKPKGALGDLELLAIRLAAMQRTRSPTLERISVSVFAGDHGISTENVSAFPETVTLEMVKNFAEGGAAVNVLSRFMWAKFEVIDVGLSQMVPLKNVISDKMALGTANFLHQPAMTCDQMNYALMAGRKSVQRAFSLKSQLFIGGEMGISNTTSAAALACALLHQAPHQLVGAGTGLSSKAIAHKTSIVEQGLKKHQGFLNTPLDILQRLGGFEITALVGAYIFAAQYQLPVLVDGFITTVAALIAIRLNPDVASWFFYAHQSEEKGHSIVLNALKVKPLLNLSMRLGEASGALVAVPLLQMACKLHNEMATFKQAHITQQ
jgi:nicotinate-nucleotide--dimethylbenzimidazole phosphoribosyltransferase